MKHGETAFVSLIQKGDAVAEIKADKAKSFNEFNRVYSSFNVTPSLYDDEKLYISKEASVDDVSLCYRFLTGNNATYAGLASACREQLIRNSVLSTKTVTNEDYLPCFLSLTGAATDDSGLMDKLIPMTDSSVSVLVIDSAVKHSLADGGYAARRKNCEDACAILGVPSLREATLEMLEEKKDALGDLCYRRARHVIGENMRVEKFAAAVAAGDWDTAGVAMRGSHASLKNDFEVSCAEVDTLVSLADTIPSAASVYGARMTGGGFGGCIVALVKSEDVEKVAQEMLDAYRNALGIETTYLVTRPGEGARVLYKA
jgi:hypothetical protein